MWHVLSRSGVATLRTAIHLLLLLTYLLYNWYFYSRLDRKNGRAAIIIAGIIPNRLKPAKFNVATV